MAADVIIDPINGQIYWNDGTGTPQSISIKGDALNAISFVGYSGTYSPGSTPSGASTLVTVNDNSGTDALVPGTTGFSLGSGTLRWKFYGSTGNFSDSTISSSLFSGSVIINGGIAVSGNASIGQSLNLYGAGTAYTSYTGFKAGSVTSNTLYTLPLTFPSTGTSVLQSDTSGIMSWVPMSASSSSSGGTVSSATQYQIAGYYAGTGASVAGSTTFTNNTATGQVQILHTTASTGTSIGALQVAGGVGISGRLTFNQAAFGTTGISANPTMAMIGQTGDPIYMSVLEDNTISFEGSQGQLFSISPNLTTGYIWAVNDISGVPLLRANANGNVYISEFGGYLGIGQTNPTYKLDLKGNFALASSNDNSYSFIFSNAAASGNNSLQIRAANSILFYNSGNSFYTGFKSNASANKLYVLPATDGSNGQFLQTDGNQNLTWATATGSGSGSTTGVGSGGQWEVAVYPGTGLSVIGYSSLKNDVTNAVVSISHTTVSTNYTNGALTVSGGVGIGGSLNVGGIGASIVGVTFGNSSITRGTWNGSVIGVQYGGTGQNLSGLSGILTISSGTVSNSTTSSAISSVLTDETGSGSLVFNSQPSFGTGVTTGDATFAVFNTTATTINAFGAATAISLGASTGKATINSTDNSTSTTTGGLVVSGGAGFAKSLSIGGYLQLFSGSNYTAFVSSASGNTVYTLPATSPATGTSILQSTSAGVMSWVPLSATSSGVVVAAATATTTISIIGVNASSGSGLAISSGVGLTYNLSNSTLTSGSYAGTWAGSTITAFYGGTGLQGPTAIGDIIVANTATTWSRYATSSTSGQVLTSNGTGNAPTWQNVPASAASSVAVTPTVLNQSFFVTTVSTSSGTGLGLSTITSFVINPSNGLVSLSGLAVTSTTSSTSTTTGSLTVTGGLGIAGNAFIGGTVFHNNNTSSSGTNSGSIVSAGGLGLAGNAFIGGTTNIQSSQVSTSTTSGALVVTGGVGIGGSLYTATGSSSSISGVIFANGNASASTYNKVIITAPTSTATLTLADGSTLATSGANSLTLTTGGTTNVTFPTGTKTLVATDVTSLASLTTASSLNSIGTITTGTWSGSAITAYYGGTGLQGPSAIGDIIVANTATTWSRYATSATSGQVLTSNGTGNAPTWQAVPPSAASSVAVTPTVLNQSFFITAVNTSSGTGLGLSTITSFVINPSNGIVSLSGLAVTSTTQSTSSSTGALIVTGGASVGQSFSIGGRLQLFNGANYTAFVSSASGNTVYTLPATSPATGSSVLQSTAAGLLSWVPMVASGSGSPAGSNKQIQYNNSTAFGGASGFEYAAGGIAVTVSVFSPSGTGYTSGLWINAINGSTTRVGIGLSNPAYELEILGEISATNKSFVIDHPTKDGMKLRYGSLEGPENGVYVRGELRNSNIIEVPDHWLGLVHPDSYTVHLTPIGRFAQLYVEKIENYNVFIADTYMNPIHCYYSVWAERKDIPKLVTEYEAQ